MVVIDGGPVMTVYPPQGVIILFRHAIQSQSPHIICTHELYGHRSHGSAVRSSSLREGGVWKWHQHCPQYRHMHRGATCMGSMASKARLLRAVRDMCVILSHSILVQWPWQTTCGRSSHTLPRWGVAYSFLSGKLMSLMRAVYWPDESVVIMYLVPFYLWPCEVHCPVAERPSTLPSSSHTHLPAENLYWLEGQNVQCKVCIRKAVNMWKSTHKCSCWESKQNLGWESDGWNSK